MKRQVLVTRCQGWKNGPDGEPVQCENPATQDGTVCPFHWGQRALKWMAVTVDE